MEEIVTSVTDLVSFVLALCLSGTIGTGAYVSDAVTVTIVFLAVSTSTGSSCWGSIGHALVVFQEESSIAGGASDTSVVFAVSSGSGASVIASTGVRSTNVVVKMETWFGVAGHAVFSTVGFTEWHWFSVGAGAFVRDALVGSELPSGWATRDSVSGGNFWNTDFVFFVVSGVACAAVHFVVVIAFSAGGGGSVVTLAYICYACTFKHVVTGGSVARNWLASVSIELVSCGGIAGTALMSCMFVTW